MGTDAPKTILILDASVLINFLRVDRIDLFQNYRARLCVTEHVVSEVTNVYPDQLLRLDAAVQSGMVEVVVVTDPSELSLIAHVRTTSANRLGIGECSAIAVAERRGFALGIDDKAARKFARTLSPTLLILTTQDLVLSLIHCGVLTVAAADKLKDDWAKSHRFRLKIASFADLLP